MKQVILLASSGQRVGKTTLAEELVKRGIVTKRESFASRIKTMCLQIHNTLGESPMTVREFFQDAKDSKILERKIS